MLLVWAGARGAAHEMHYVRDVDVWDMMYAPEHKKSPTPGLRMNPPIKVGARSMLQSFRINGYESLLPHAI